MTHILESGMHRDRKRHTRQTVIYRDTQRKCCIQRHAEKVVYTETRRESGIYRDTQRKWSIQRHAEKVVYTETRRESGLYRDTRNKHLQRHIQETGIDRDTH